MGDSTFPNILACPVDGTGLRDLQGGLLCQQGHRFAIEEGVPVFTEHPRREYQPLNMPSCSIANDGEIDPFVNNWIVNTNGNLYWRVRGRLPRYPVPLWPFEAGDGRVLVDLGCGWGRWCLAAANAGFIPVGMDLHLDALQAAGRIRRRLGKQIRYCCTDIEQLPAQSASVDAVFSYSVLQHLERAKVGRIFLEAARILKPGGTLYIQLPNTAGFYSRIQQMRRGFREANPDSFEMRYWSRGQIRETLLGAGFGEVEIEADGFFSQNPQLTDLDLLSPAGKLVVLISYTGREIARRVRPLVAVADSLWVKAQKPLVLNGGERNAVTSRERGREGQPPEA